MIRPLILFTVLLASTLLAEVQHRYADMAMVKSSMPIIDIRTPSEWRQTGLLKGSIPIMFFDERGGYDLNRFLSQLQPLVKKGEPFALICNSGSRTRLVANYLSQHYGYSVINLKGGIRYAIAKRLPIEPYRK